MEHDTYSGMNYFIIPDFTPILGVLKVVHFLNGIMTDSFFLEFGNVSL